MVMIIFLGGMLVKVFFFYLSLLSGPKEKSGLLQPQNMVLSDV